MSCKFWVGKFITLKLTPTETKLLNQVKFVQISDTLGGHYDHNGEPSIFLLPIFLLHKL